MNELMKVIKGRRSIRKFQDRAVSEDKLNTILESIQWSPSWANTQCWEVIVVKDRANKESLHEAFITPNPGKKAVIQAAVVLAICGKLKNSGYYKGQAKTKFGDWFMFDLGIATQTICLAAHDLGLGTVIVGLFDQDKAKEALRVPEGYEVVTLIPLGYAAKGSAAPKRREISEFIHHERF